MPKFNIYFNYDVCLLKTGKYLKKQSAQRRHGDLILSVFICVTARLKNIYGF